jgi:CCR4-NOT transcription complex subunit 1
MMSSTVSGIGFNLVPRVNSSLSSGLDLGSVNKLSEFSRQRIVSVVSMLEEYGPQASSTPETFRKVLLSSTSRLEEEQVASIICLVLNRTADGLTWNLEVVADVLFQESRGLNWMLIAKSLDSPRLSIRNDTEFLILTKLFLRISGSTISVSGLLATLWNNRSAQFAILALAANAPRSLVDFAPLVSQDQLLNSEGLLTPPNFSWLCLPLYVRLFDLAANGFTMDVLELMMKAASAYPEYVLTSLAQVQDSSGVRNELLQRLLPIFTGLPGSRPTYLLVMRRLSLINLDLLLRLCLIAFRKATKLSELVALENISKSLGSQFVRRLETEGSPEELLGYWCLKADKQEINLEEKLLKMLDLNPKLLKSFVLFLKGNADNVRSRSHPQADGILSGESLSLVMKMCQQYSSLLSQEEVKVLTSILSQHQSSLSGASSSTSHFPAAPRDHYDGVELSRLPPGPESEEIEAIANAYFQKIYTSDLSVGDVINLLKQFKSSADKKDQEVFRCMVHNLFDEYRFFHKYPEKELQITGRFFGSLIQHQLVASITLGIALRYVLEALRKDPELGEGNDKMFRFGLIALDQFRSRLIEWPQFCSHLIQIPHFSRHSPDLFQEAQKALTNPQAVSHQQQGHAVSQGGALFYDPTPPAQHPSIGYSYPSQQFSQALTQPPVSSVSSHASAFSPTYPAHLPESGVNLQSSVPASGFAISGMSAGNSDGRNQFEISLATSSVVETAIGESDKHPVKSAEIERMMIVNRPIIDSIVPPDNIRDQIQFIVNNVAKSNVDGKVNELKELLLPQFFGWFATYLVEKRVSSQPNLHPLYLLVLDSIEFPALLKFVLDSTFYNVTKYLSSPTITTSSNERSVLRYFGMWLGQLTLARNRPILQKRMDLKSLLFWGYETGRLIAVCTFVAKVIEAVKDSKVFRPPNPWLMAILGVLRELHEIEDLKLNIKFEVQVLCKNINVKIDDIKKTNFLSKCTAPVKDHRNPDFNVKSAAPVQSSVVPAAPTAVAAPPASGGISTDNKDLKVEVVESSSTSHVSLTDINSAITHVLSSVIVNPSLSYFSANPNQRRLVAAAVERGIKEIIQSAVDKSVSIATATSKQLILKDFSTEVNESAMKTGAHLMVSNLTGSLVLATCKEPLRVSIGNHLRTLLAPSISDQTIIEQIVQVCSSDNLELGSSLIEKVATEKSIRDIDEVLSSAYAARRRAKESSTPFLDTSVPVLPVKFSGEPFDALRLPPGGLSSSQLVLYEEFPKCRNAFSVSSEQKPMPPLASGGAVFTMPQALEANQVLFIRLESSLKTLQTHLQGREISLSMLGDHEIIQLLREMVVVIQRTQPAVKIETATTFCESIFSRMFESVTQPDPLRLEVIVYILEAVREACGGSKGFSPDVISWLGKYASLVNNDEISRKVYRHILILLLRAKLLRSLDVDLYLSIHIDAGRNLFWLEVALSFIKQCLVENLGTVYDYTKTLDVVTKIRLPNVMLKRPLQKWLADIKALATAQEEQRAHVGLNPVAGTPLPSAVPKDGALREQITLLLDRWIRVWNSVNDQVFSQYLQLMHQCGVLKTEEAADKFFKLATEICAEACLKGGHSASTTDPSYLNYTVMDAISRLFLLLVRLADKETSDINVRVNLLHRILNAVVRAIHEDHETKKVSKQAFDQRPYYRLLSNLSQDLGIPDPKQEQNPALLPLLAIYTQSYLALQPNNIPGFAFSWLQLVCKRSFLPHLLKHPKGWPSMQRLLNALFSFLQPFVKYGILPDPVKKLYKGALRLLLVLLHDFPEFLCDYHLSFCDVIPVNAIQLRNLILSAFPKTMRLPDPFTPNLKLDIVGDSSQTPKIMVDYLTPIAQIKSHIDNYLTLRQPSDLPSKLASVLTISPGGYNVPLITSLIVYVGNVIITQIPSKGLVMDPAMDLIRGVIEGLDAEGRFVLLNSIANQLRYPNSHTSLFSNILLSVFMDATSEFTQEQVTRVLVERLIVHRPHPVSVLLF